ncbi:hypothetical protein PR202_ga15102 [Eleusine coracana subsp. coracana]|uniref:beta-galactosidase n=1 Tax=Eleusine coracana subsp. coracana TaxID=191504 RepID=A0AAV5CJ68_ELECO|nr:hypothetical protein PR202_ga15102 [Eleusine coracana subsp. coracana]
MSGGVGALALLMVATAAVILAAFSPAANGAVSYDHRAVVINGQRRILMSGSIHYPRSTPEMWPDLIQKAKDGGLDVIQTYVFWNGHEPVQGQYYFGDRYDLVRFVKLAKQAGLYVHLRIGPYVCAEWNFGGFPVWLKYVPGMSFRTDNGPFKAAMQTFVEKIVSMMKSEGCSSGRAGRPHHPGAGGERINTCNGFYCDYFTPNSNSKPTMWTEAWTGWFTSFGGAVPHRPVEDLAFAVARFVQKGGSFVNYYMYHGGTNFDRTSGGPFIATSYDYDAPIDEYGLLRQPKWGHLRDLHKAIKQAEPALVSGDPTIQSIGNYEKAYVYKSSSGACAAFLSNYKTTAAAKVVFNGQRYDLPAWSISILPDCKTVAFNTATVKEPSAPATMSPAGGFSWQSYSEATNALDDRAFTKDGLVEQLSMTWDKSDYLWYTTYVNIDSNEQFLKSGKWPQLTIYSAGHSLQVFVNGQSYGAAYGGYDSPKLTYSGYVKMWQGSNKISVLSAAVGLPNQGTHYEACKTNGVLGSARTTLISSLPQIGPHRRIALVVHSAAGASSVEWGSSAAGKQPVTWHKAYFNAPAGNAPVALDMGSMGKGQIWVNGHHIGRYWSYKASGNCGGCSYAGTFTEKKCLTNCGDISQRWYHVPRSWLNPSGNLLVVLEEFGGDLSGVKLMTRTT